MSPTNGCVWYRHPGSSFYIRANSVSSPRLYVQPSYYNQSYQHCPQQRVTTEEIEDIDEGYDGDEELDDSSIIDISTEECCMDNVANELNSFEEEETIRNGDLDALSYSPISICAWLSTGTKELMAEKLCQVNGEIGDDVDVEESCEVAAEDASTALDCVQDGAAVGDVMEHEHGRVDLQLLEGNDKKLAIAKKVKTWSRQRSG